MKHLLYISLCLSLSLNAQNMVIDCVSTIKTTEFISVSDTLKGYNGLIMMQSKSGLKIKNVEGNVTFIHGLMARENVGDLKKPYLYIGKCTNTIKVSSRIKLEVGSKYCKKRIEIFDQ